MNVKRKERVCSGSADVPAGEVPDFQNRISFLVYKLNAKLEEIANNLFEDRGLDAYSSRILVLLLERGEMRVGELVRIMDIPQSTVSHQLQRLEQRKIIRRRRTREDNRSVAVTLTPLGLKIAEECDRLSLEVQADLVSSLAKRDIEQLSRLLPALYSTLSRFRRSQDPTE